MDASLKFRFDRATHEYTALDTGEVLPHITGMLEKAGLVDDLWFTEESSERGTCVHKMTADYDLGALDLESCVSIYRGYLLAHYAAMRILRPTILAVEEALVHPGYRYGGRLDRDVLLYGVRGTFEIKTAVPQKSHQIQTALQAILLAGTKTGIPAPQLGRWCLYIKKDGKFKLEEHNDLRDFDEARRVIRISCGERVSA